MPLLVKVSAPMNSLAATNMLPEHGVQREGQRRLRWCCDRWLGGVASQARFPPPRASVPGPRVGRAA